MLQEIILTKDEKNQVFVNLKHFNANPYAENFESFYENIISLQSKIPQRIATAIQNFKNNLGNAGVLLIRDLPINIDLPTPIGFFPYAETKNNLVGTEKYIVMLTSFIGKPFGFSDWHQGEKIQNIYPIFERSKVQCAANSVYLEMHTETAFRPATPSQLALMCLREDREHQAKTLFCNLQRVIDHLDEDIRYELKQAKFFFSIGQNQFTEPKPIDTTQNGYRRIHYAEALMAKDELSQAALDKLNQEILANQIELEMRPGDFVLIDNLHTCHGRTAYTPKFDGTDRWLQRVLLGNMAAGLV